MVESTTLCGFTLLQLIEPGQLLQAVIVEEEASLMHTFSVIRVVLSLGTMESTCLHGRKGFTCGLLPWVLEFFRQD